METLGVKVEPGVERIQSGSELLAIILSYRYREEGIRFFTPDEFSQQLAFMRHPAGKLIAPHVHNPVPRAFPKLNDSIELNLTVKGGEPL